MRPCFQEYTVLVTLLVAATACAQTDSPAFEVASIRPNRSASGHSSSHGSKGQIVMENVSLKQLIERAWDVRDFSISGPGWLDAEHFDIMAKIPPGSTKQQLLPMLRSLLEHRFKIVVHFETKKLSGYALEREKTAAQLVPADDALAGSSTSGRGKLQATGSMAMLADQLARQLNEPVQDLTGLKGTWKLNLEWQPEESRPDAPAETPTGPTIFTALREQAGLRLRPQKVTVDILVVDSAERVPTDN